MRVWQMKVLLVLKYLCIAIAAAAIMEAAILFLGYWLNVHIPVVVTLGLLMGVLAWFAGKLRKPNP
jgi:predicted signal transduction protein with EAL and GGDEF domain